MRLGTGPWIAAGIVALAGAGIVAVPPLTSPPPDVEVPVQLTSGADAEPITAWMDLFEGGSVDATPILDEWSIEAVPVWEQSIPNQIGYSGELPNFQIMFGQFSDNLQAGEPFGAWAATSPSPPLAPS